MPTVAFHTLGCKLNQCETAQMEEALLNQGFRVVPWNQTAAVRVLNTCTVTSKTDRECRRLIRRAKREDPSSRMVVTGCYAQVAPERVAAIPEVDLVLGNTDKLRLAEHLADLHASAGDGRAASMDSALPETPCAGAVRSGARTWSLRQGAVHGSGAAITRRSMEVGQMFGQPQFVCVPQHQIDLGNRSHSFGRYLRVAAGDHHPAGWVFSLSPADQPAALTIGFGGDRAGVEHPHRRGLIPGNHPETLVQQRFFHLGGLALIELAAEGVEGDGRHSSAPAENYSRMRTGVPSGA